MPVLVKPRQASQRAAAAKNLQKARQSHRKGGQSAAQLRSERANLVLARAALKAKQRPTANQAAQAKRLATQPQSPSTSELMSLITQEQVWGFAKSQRHAMRQGYLQARRTYLMMNLVGKAHPIGAARIAITMWKEPSRRKPTGLFQKFRPRLSPAVYEGRTTWKVARVHHFRKRLHIRRHKVKALRHWKKRQHRLRPR